MRKTLSRLWGDERLLVSTIFLLAIAARLGAVFYLGVPDLVESSESGQVAAGLVAGQGYTFDFYGYRVADPLRSFIPPLYTLFVAVFLRFASEPAVALGIVQAFLSSLTCALIYLIAEDLSGRTVGALSGLATALYPVFVIQAARPFSLTLHSFLLALLLWLLLGLPRRSHPTTWVAIGIVAGLNALGRSSMLGFFAGIMGWLWLNRKGIPEWHRATTVIILFTLFTLLPWTLRNYHLHSQLVLLSTNGGFTFWNGNNPFTTGSSFDVHIEKVNAYANTGIDPSLVPGGIVELRPYPLPCGLGARLHELTEVELDRELYLAGLRFIKENPGQWTDLVKQKVVSFWWFRPNIGRSSPSPGAPSPYYDSRWIMPYKALYILVFPLFIVGLVLSRSRWRVHSIFYLLFGYLTILYIAFNVITRYRWEIEPFILIFAIVAIVHIAQRIVGSFSLLRTMLLSSAG